MITQRFLCLFTACNVVYLNNVDTESLTGPQAISKAVQQTFSKGKVDTTVATFKVSSDGITVTDTNHRSVLKPRAFHNFINLFSNLRLYW